MIESLRVQVQGRVSQWLQQRVAARAEELVVRLIAEAATLWRSEGFSRFDDGEISCTVRMFDCCDRIIAAGDPTWLLVHVDYDGPQLTAEMRAGRADARRASRPDLGVRVGTSLVPVEAKRLASVGALPGKYVHEGMMRFLDRKYVSTAPIAGAMIGFVMEDEVAATVTAVNNVISRDPDLGSSHELRIISVTSPLSLHRSSHAPLQDLLHFLVDVAA